MRADFIRPRLVLVTTPLPDGEAGVEALRAALGAGDVASVILAAAGRGADAFQDFAEPLVPMIQDYGAAAIIADDTRCAGRVRADGLHVSGGDVETLTETMARFSPKLIVGASGFTLRHEALEAGERMPDYLFFGRLGGDDVDLADADALEMAEWWAEIVEIPCIVMGGRDIESTRQAAETGAEFVALSAAVLQDPGTAAAMVVRANAIIDAVAESVAA
ncbi:thiamine phosphate synthase [Aureimonas sp. SA4125]|uniref:thiamine phosphate synthase n=1 Tax=Aureimonas sp. SA4125 TaxID=2826993 RepID=UPI001CC72309|nr:thiamine phosphate synthase [Aureimonas sp. SA4125]BDA83521.1 thiamine phosphate synthase [Aureimonas sp. SA4125]